jgi:hypothetical protein
MWQLENVFNVEEKDEKRMREECLLEQLRDKLKNVQCSISLVEWTNK